MTQHRSIAEEMELLDEGLRAALIDRAQKLRTPRTAAAAEDEGAVAWMAAFRLGEHRYAVPLAALRAVLPARRISSVPLAEAHVVGIVQFEGTIITALSLSALLSVRSWRQDPSVLLVVDPGWGELHALDCEETPVAVTIPRKRLAEGSAIGGGPLTEVALDDGGLLRVIDLDRLLDRRGRARHG